MPLRGSIREVNMLRTITAAFLMLALVSGPASALSKVFVSSTGNDNDDGARSRPKRGFQSAHDSVDAGGQIVVLDTAGYGTFTITKSIGVVVPPGVNGFVTAPSGAQFAINVLAGPSDIVTLRGLIVEGTSNTVRGINISGGGTVVIEDTVVRNVQDGISVNATAHDMRVVVRGGAIRATSQGVFLHTSSVNLKLDALVTDTEVTATSIAFRADNSVGASVRLVANRCVVSGATDSVFISSGTNAQVVADGCTISGNATVFKSLFTGQIFTRSNNTIFNNATTGDTPTPLNPQ